MDITWHGYSCFRITERGHTSVVTDPYQPARELANWRLKGDLVTVSHEGAARHAAAIRDQKYVIAAPGEYEVGELFVTGIALHQHEPETDNARKNVAYHFEYPNGLNVLHLGVLHQVPDQSIFEGLDQVNALLLPVEDALVAGDKLPDLISVIEPNYVAPMQPFGLSEAEFAAAVESFRKAVGASDVEVSDALRITPANLSEQTQVVQLRANFTPG
ncbi:MAG: MBL fold metallo-hydrolase [Chloroflexi bacterium]|nr:MBL fold metallo-hydrolase [Chloroflexota bacterium]